ncbi:MAG: P1 family peptidase [Chloroflexota bacterium]|nr:P1 family peptidase [Chloroflexota bacterium]
MHDAITDVAGIRVGHYTDKVGVTGCTVVLCESGAVGGLDLRGSAPGTRETDLLHPLSWAQQVHGIVLSGGSAFGLDTAGGVMRFLEEGGYGLHVGVGRVPIVPAAILFDLSSGDPKARPGAEEGYQACLVAEGGPVAEGTVGAGTGAAVGKLLGREVATKGGIGTASCKIASGAIVAAIVAVNSFGDVVDPNTGMIIAGPRRQDGKGFLSTVDLLKGNDGLSSPVGVNTTIGVVATNVGLSKEETNKLAQTANAGVAQAVRPSHTIVDGDALFALSLPGDDQVQASIVQLGAIAAEVVACAIVNAVVKAEGLAGIPAVKEVLGCDA